MRYKKIILLLIILFIFSGSLAFFITSKNNKVVTENKGSNTSSEKPAPDTTAKPADPPPVKEDVSSEITITSVGDCTLGTDDKFSYNTLPSVLQKNNNDLSYFFRNVKDIFDKDDITTANLETTLTTTNNKLKKSGSVFFNFKGDPSYAKALTLGSIEAVNLSNNHIYDYQNQGFQDTITALKANNVNYFGEGNKYITTVKGIKFGFLGYAAFNDSTDFRTKLKSDIAELKQENCIVIINFHWGIEGQYNHTEAQTNLAHFSIDNGADLIIGHHPHVIEGIEKYKNKFICYSLGNFCFGGNSNPPDKDTFIFQIKYRFTNNILKDYGVKIIPCSVSSVVNINDYCPTPLKDAKKTELLNKITKLSPNLNVNFGDDFTFINANN